MFTEVADECNAIGVNPKTIIRVDAVMTKDMVADGIWRPIQVATLGFPSTQDLTTIQVNEVLDPFIKAVGELGVTASFSSIKDYLHNNQ